jgi:hypothetical protein
MSFRIISSASTRYGIPLGEPMELVTPRFLIHECGFQTRIEYWTTDTVLCPFWCLWHVMEKENWVESEGACWELGPECILLKPAHVSHLTRSCRPAAQVWLHFSLIPEYAFETSTPFVVPLNTLLREQLSAVMDACNAAREGDTRVLYHQAKALLNTCFAAAPLPMRVLPDALRAILQLIDNEPADDLSNSRLARLAGMSRAVSSSGLNRTCANRRRLMCAISVIKKPVECWFFRKHPSSRLRRNWVIPTAIISRASSRNAPVAARPCFAKIGSGKSRCEVAISTGRRRAGSTPSAP